MPDTRFSLQAQYKFLHAYLVDDAPEKIVFLIQEIKRWGRFTEGLAVAVSEFCLYDDGWFDIPPEREEGFKKLLQLDDPAYFLKLFFEKARSGDAFSRNFHPTTEQKTRIRDYFNLLLTCGMEFHKHLGKPGSNREAELNKKNNKSFFYQEIIFHIPFNKVTANNQEVFLCALASYLPSLMLNKFQESSLFQLKILMQELPENPNLYLYPDFLESVGYDLTDARVSAAYRSLLNLSGLAATKKWKGLEQYIERACARAQIEKADPIESVEALQWVIKSIDWVDPNSNDEADCCILQTELWDRMDEHSLFLFALSKEVKGRLSFEKFSAIMKDFDEDAQLIKRYCYKPKESSSSAEPMPFEFWRLSSTETFSEAGKKRIIKHYCYKPTESSSTESLKFWRGPSAATFSEAEKKRISVLIGQKIISPFIGREKSYRNLIEAKVAIYSQTLSCAKTQRVLRR